MEPTASDTDDLSPIQRAVSALGWGGQSKLARELSSRGKSCTPQAVQKWCATGHVPADRVADIEEITGTRLREQQIETSDST